MIEINMRLQINLYQEDVSVDYYSPQYHLGLVHWNFVELLKAISFTCCY